MKEEDGVVDRGTGSRASTIRSRLRHPIIDGDGHSLEHIPALDAYMREEGIRGGLPALGIRPRLEREHTEERARVHGARIESWTIPARHTLDLATATLPPLLYERLDEIGIDFAVVYPTFGLMLIHLPDDDLRRAACRAMNRYSADVFADYADRLTPVAAIPMTTPEEAVEELHYAVETLGLKAVLIAGFAQRVPDDPGADPAVLQQAAWLDTYGLDSMYDYDPVWRACVELGVAPGSHSIGMGWGSRRSPTSYVYNQIGHFAAAGEALAKSLFLGGVTTRFPELRIALLEGGVAWAVSLYADLVSRWEKRNPDAIQHYNPASVDGPRFEALFAKYAGRVAGTEPTWWHRHLPVVEAPDDFAHCSIERPEDIRDHFVPNFTFGCEADDPMTKLAFDRALNPFGAQLRAIFSSDIGHWDVRDMLDVVGEAYELVERGWLDDDEFEAFMFANAARFYTDANPRFFEGTVVEADVAKLLAAAPGAEPPTPRERPADVH
jgi:predicted TIM-barrel fold metal-dependent hydrolase